MVANSSTDGREGIGLQKYLVGVVKSFGSDKSNVRGYIHLNGAGMLTGRFKHCRTNGGNTAVVMNMFLILFAKITNGA
ncbi:MAG: hypothetical protein A2W27_05855 [Deltaproteobacteria bacterium RBG_16_44_11]|nr:MAG: hypothetical protein A2W27_05855 [Deltaproteobacteria bacterium RBG_16_44_11]